MSLLSSEASGLWIDHGFVVQRALSFAGNEV